MRPDSDKRFYGSLPKLLLIITGVFGGFYILFDVVPSTRNDIHARAVGTLPALDQSREPGRRIIFRLDDVEQGVREQQVFDLLALFDRRGVPIEIGIVPFATDSASYALPGLKPYLSRGIADINVHGVTHKPYEFHSEMSGSKRSVLHAGLVKTTHVLQNFYGVRPLAFLVPYDVFDEHGYEAVRRAGFRILSSQWQTDSHRGTAPVDYEGRPAGDGLHRIPAVDDAVAWNAEAKRWGEFQPLSNLLYSVNASLDELGVAVLSLHPAAFEGDDSRTDPGKLKRLDALVTQLQELGRISTFRNWYCTHADPQRARGYCN